MNQTKRILMSGGGTGGHIYPAVAIAKALVQLLGGAEVLFVGAKGRMEMEKIPKEGFDIKGLYIAGFQRGFSIKNILKNCILPFKLLYSLGQTFYIIYKFRPDVVIGTGGYASGPTLKMAQWMGIPTFIQEQNALPGYTNKLLATKAYGVFVSFDNMEKEFSNKNVWNFGNAIRLDFGDGLLNKADGLKAFGLSADMPVVFATGGSLGANAINQAIEKNLETIVKSGIQLIWQCGSSHISKYKHLETNTIKIVDFIPNIATAYAAADLIVSRAGGAIFEMFVVGKPLIILPSPYVAEDHQTKNAQALSEKNAVIMIQDKEADQKLVPTMIELVADQKRCNEMSNILKSMAKPNASIEIGKKIIEMLNW